MAHMVIENLKGAFIRSNYVFTQLLTQMCVNIKSFGSFIYRVSCVMTAVKQLNRSLHMIKYN